ncbi:hypothetical protein LCM23_17045 [Cytobacillus kochii]|nr:hypothetical protein [Cytobacillus kochii]MCA1027803.1 hypothetical protein [Cytobacillus kochii]
MTIRELINQLQLLDQNAEVFISCEAGCVSDNEITIIEKDTRVYLEIE